jgi:hypothetical protein
MNHNIDELHARGHELNMKELVVHEMINQRFKSSPLMTNLETLKS